MIGSSDHPSFVQIIRLLACAFEVRTNSPELFNRLPLISQRSEQDVPLVRRETVSVIWDGSEFRITGCGAAEDFEFSALSAVESLSRRLHARAFAALPDHVRLRAAIGTCGKTGFLVVGPGKTCLTVQLMLAGYEMAGDALVLLRGGEGLAFPQRFELREESLGLFPELAALKRFAGAAASPQLSRILMLDPIDFGLRWRIAPARVRAIFNIEPNYGGRTRLLACGKVETVRRILSHCAPPLSGRRDWLAELSMTVDRAETILIEIGDLETAAALLGERLA